MTNSIVGPVAECAAPPLHLRAWREYRALTQQDLAERAGVARRTIITIEQGASRPRPATVRALAKALRVKPEQLRATPPGEAR